jgi:hypothetical protein
LPHRAVWPMEHTAPRPLRLARLPSNHAPEANAGWERLP